MKTISYIIIILLSSAPRSAASVFADDTSGTTTAFISFIADREGVKIYEDSVYLGTTPCDSLHVSVGKHIFRYIHGDQRNWLHSEIAETLHASSGKHYIRKIAFPFVYRISSEPYGAEIHIGDSIVGQTPFILSTQSKKKLIVLTKEGYNDITVPLSDDQTFINVKLESNAGSSLGDKERYLSVEPSDNNLNIYLATGATVLTGVVSAYCKIKADSYYSDYQRTNDPATLQKVRSYDTAAGISLAASEISLFFLSYLLLSR